MERYLLKSIWTYFDGTTGQSVGTHAYPSLEHINHAINYCQEKCPNVRYLSVKAPANTPLLDINWENHLKY